MAEIVIHRFLDHERAKPLMENATNWLTDEMGFDRYMIKMCPSKHRWDDCLAPADNRIACEERSFRWKVEPLLRTWYWQAHLDEMLQDTGIQENKESCWYILRQSGPKWVRWYSIFLDDRIEASDARYYIATIFEDEMDAFMYKLSV